LRGRRAVLGLSLLAFLVTACAGAGAALPTGQPQAVKVLAVESFLADIAQNVAGTRVQVETLIPLGADPHEYEPTPQDVARVADSSVLIVNGGGVETWLEKTLQNAGGKRLVIVASQGLKSRSPGAGEAAGSGQVDPHFWLAPNLAVHYVEQIRDGLIQADPAGKDIYQQNAAAYIHKLNDLDTWIQTQVSAIPAERRLLVTNHESLGYYADRYGFRIVGAVIPSISTDASPSARQIADLVQAIRKAAAPAVFLEVGVNQQLGEQVAQETGIKIVTDLYTETLSAPGGPAPDYLSMMKHDTQSIIEALK
jgi:manganese/iron transport system substrate-binding protein